MFGPWALTHVVYVLLVIAFAGIITYMFVYNAKSKKRQQQVLGKGEPASHEAGILAAEESITGRDQP